MRKKNIYAQLSNKLTFNMVYDDMIDLACNVYQYKNVPKFIDIGYVNSILLFNGAIVWFYDEVMKELLALPFDVINGYDMYGRPLKVVARSYNGSYRKELKEGEFVIMYDNTRKKSIIPKIRQRAERIALSIRTEDINVVHQRTPRIWKTSQDKAKAVEDTINDIDSMRENVIGYETLDVDEISEVMAPAPYVVDKLDMHIEKLWADFYRLIGITSVSVEKRERLVTDEVTMSQGGVVASRYSRYTPRVDAINKINEMFKDYLDAPIEIEYYDGIPSDEQNDTQSSDLGGVTNDVFIS